MKSKRIVSSILAISMVISLAACDAKPTETAAPAEPDEPAATGTPALEGYNLLWSDEFDGTALDESKWNRETREPGWTNNELQEYTSSDENIFVRNGSLVLKAIKT